MKRKTLKVSEDTHKKLKQLAIEENKTLEQVVDEILQDYLKQL